MYVYECMCECVCASSDKEIFRYSYQIEIYCSESANIVTFAVNAE